jgi:hypothetical protein
VTADQVIQAVVAWARETLPELIGSYAYAPAGKTEALPDVVADHATIEYLIDDDRRFPWLSLQQTILAVHSVGMSFMVTNANEGAAAAALRGYADALAASLLADGTLGGRVPMASPLMTFDFTRPFVEYQDGTRGREVTMELAVGVPMEAPA